MTTPESDTKHIKNTKLNGAELSMLPSLLKFFENPDNFTILKRYRQGQGTLFSVSLLDWFTVNYCKKYGTEFAVVKKGRRKVIHVEQAYNAALSAYRKEYFDPFARGSKKGEEIGVMSSEGEVVRTTIRQLNYFRWAIDKGIIEYVDKNVEAIYKDMAERSNRGKKKGNGKKQQLSVSASKTLGIHDIKMTVQFGTK